MQKTEQREQEIAEARERLVRGMRKQLLGPGSEVGEDPAVDEAHEIITSSPVMRYTCGVLYPQPSLMGTQDAPDIPETEEERAWLEKQDFHNSAEDAYTG